MIDLLARNPLLLLFLIAAIGFPLGRISVFGVKVGVASVLFAGLAVGAMDPRLELPEVIYQLGLVLFVYTIGLGSGPAFFAAFRRRGVRDNMLVAGTLAVAALVAAGIGRALTLDAATTAGLFAGGLTNTPALAAVVEAINTTAPPELVEALRARPVVGYSIAYPFGVLGMVLAIVVAQRIWRVDYRREAHALEYLGATSQEIENRTIVVTSTDVTRDPLTDLARERGWDVLFTRAERGGTVELITPDYQAAPGDRVLAVGLARELDTVERAIGERAPGDIGLDREQIDYRRIFVSDRRLSGRTLREVQLPARFGGMITRIRRGDVELMPRAETVLELGDRVRVVAPRERLDVISRFFGDSYRALAEVDVATFALGLFAGLLLGLVPLPLPGIGTVRLGLAGGPLLVGLVLGARGFTGPLVWTLPYGPNLTIRQLGLVLFLAGVGTQAGYAFVETLMSPTGLVLLAGAAVVTTSAALLLLAIGHRVLGIPMSLLTGMLAGMQTQPAVLGYATEQSGNDLPNIGYATVYPTATLLKIILAQVLLALAG